MGRQVKSQEAWALGHSLYLEASLWCLPASRTHYQFGMRRVSQKPLATWRGPLISNSWGLPFLSIPQPQAEWSPGQSTKWLFATKHLEMPEGSSWPVSPGSQSHSHTHSVKASVPAGMAKLGPASLSPPAEGTGAEPLDAVETG